MNSVFKIGIVGIVGLALTACSGGKSGPDEFGVLPTKPLEIPEDLEQLPEPSKTVRNRADQRPVADGISALGGDAARLDSKSINASEQALLNAASRFGVISNIRSVTAQEDEEYRKDNKGRILERLVGNDIYNIRYEKQALDAYPELLRLRRAGVRTPTAPPPNQ